MEKHRYGFDITELAKRWADGVASPAKGIVLSAPAIESGSNCWYKTFASYNRSTNKPSLSIQYETKMVSGNIIKIVRIKKGGICL